MSGSDYLRNTEPDPPTPGMAALAALMEEWHESARTEIELDGMSVGVVESLFISGFLKALPAALGGDDLVKLIVASKDEFARRIDAGQVRHEP